MASFAGIRLTSFPKVLGPTLGVACPALPIEVPAKDRKKLRELLSGDVQQVRVVLRALALSQLAKRVSAPRISAVVPLTPQAIHNVAHRYQEGGLERALCEKERPGAAEVLDEGQQQRIIAMVYSDPPKSRARWTVRLVRILLLHHDLKPWRGKNVVRG